MASVLILTHGGLAGELLAAARMIAGELHGFQALSLDWYDSIDAAQEKVRSALMQMDHEQGLLILTDIFGGTPTNVALRFREEGRVEVLAGVNLPMVVRLGCSKHRSMPLRELADLICEKGKASICCNRANSPLLVSSTVDCARTSDG